jgi:DNA-binding Xre family transcriptional regulator
MSLTIETTHKGLSINGEIIMTATASEYLRARIKAFVMEKDTSLRKLSKETGVDYTTIHRIHSGKKRGVVFFDARRILAHIDPENSQAALARYFPREMAELSAAGVSPEKINKDVALMQCVVESKETYNIFIFVSEGLPKALVDVTKEFGRRGDLILNDLIEQGAISHGPDGYLQAFSNEFINAPISLLKEVAKLNVDSLDPLSPGCLIRNRAMGLNLEGATAAYNALAEASAKLQEISANQEYKGSLVMLFSLLCGAHSTKKPMRSSDEN